MGWDHYETVDPTSQKRAPGWQGKVWCPSTNSSIHQIFNISYFLQFNSTFEKNYLFPKMPQNQPTFAQNRRSPPQSEIFQFFKTALFFFPEGFAHCCSLSTIFYRCILFFYHHMTGSFAVICLMVASVVEREVANMSIEPSPTPTPINGSMPSPVPTTASSGLWSPVDAMKLKVAISLACLIGIIQVI